jgi:hypothetical protein
LGSFNEVGRFFSERGIRRAATEQPEQQGDDFGVALGRAATASLDRRKAGTAVKGDPGLPTRLGSFDSGSGRFLRPDDNVQVQQVEEVSALGGADRGLEAIPEGESELDEQIRRHTRLFGDTESIIAGEQDKQKLAAAIAAFQQAGASESEVNLLRSGAIEPEDVFERLGEREGEQRKEARNRNFFQQLNQSDPVRYPEFLPGFDYEKAIVAQNTAQRTSALEDKRQQGRVSLEELRQQGRVDLKTDEEGNETIKMPAGAARSFIEQTFFTTDEDGFAVPPPGFERTLQRLQTELIKGTATQQDIDAVFDAIDNQARSQAREQLEAPGSGILGPRLGQLVDSATGQPTTPTTTGRQGAQPPSETSPAPDAVPPTMSPQRKSEVIAALQEQMALTPEANPIQILREAGFPDHEIREILGL